jgi:hypothetical protein
VPSSSPNHCVGSISIVEDAEGLSGWRVAYVGDASSVAGACSEVDSALGSETTVYATCSAAHPLSVQLGEADPSLAPLATFEVECTASPVLVYRSGADPNLAGHFATIYFVDPPEGDYRFLVQTTDESLPNSAPVAAP